MRRKGPLIAAATLIIGVLILVSTLPLFTIKKTLIVHAALDQVAVQFNRAENWKNWYPQYNSAGTLTVLNPLSVSFDKRRHGRTFRSYLTAAPTGHGTATTVILAEKTDGVSWIREQFANDDFDLLHNLRSFMEDDSRRYGFPIAIIPVSDTLILTAKKIVDSQQQFATILSLRNELQKFIIAGHIRSAGDYYFVSSIDVAGGKTEIATGVPVLDAKNRQQGFEFLKLPKNGRLIAGNYKGAFTGKRQLYLAIDKYILNNKLKKVAQPLEKYRSSDTLLSGNQNIDLTIYYPIY